MDVHAIERSPGGANHVHRVSSDASSDSRRSVRSFVGDAFEGLSQVSEELSRALSEVSLEFANKALSVVAEDDETQDRQLFGSTASEAAGELGRVEEGREVPPEEVVNGTQDKGKPWEQPEWLKHLRMHQEWWCLWIALVCFILGLGVCVCWPGETTSGSVLGLRLWEWGWHSSPLLAWNVESAAAILALFFVYLALLMMESKECGKIDKLFSGPLFHGYSVMFALGLLAQWIGKEQFLKRLGLGYALWSFFLGGLLGNMAPPKLKAGLGPSSKQAEFFIKCGVVLLAAPLEDIAKAGLRGLAVAWGETLLTWHLMVALGLLAFRKVTPEEVVTVSTSITVCGASAAAAAAATMGCPNDQLVAIVAMVTLFSTVTMLVLPPLTGLLGMGSAQAGAALGGSVDATGNVVAAAAMLDDGAAEDMAAIVKMAQNMILPVIVIIISVLKGQIVAWHARLNSRSTSEEEPEKTEAAKSESLLQKAWAGLPKFIVGYLVLALLLSLVRASGVLSQEVFQQVLQFLRHCGTWWFALGFVGIGILTNARELLGKLSLSGLFGFALAAELLDIVMTFMAAEVAFIGYSS